MAQFYPWPTGDGEIVYGLRVLFGVAMLLAIVMALRAIRRRDFSAHGAWMIRGYAIAEWIIRRPTLHSGSRTVFALSITKQH